MSHGASVWEGNQKEFIENGQIGLHDCIASRDEIMVYLMRNSLPKEDAYLLRSEALANMRETQ